MDNVIVTGAYGFLGKGLVEELSRVSKKVYAIVRRQSDIIKFPENVSVVACDLSESAELLSDILPKGSDAWYHLAWEGSYGEKRADLVIQLKNIEMSKKCFEIASDIKCKKFIGMGTISEYLIINDAEKGRQLNSPGQLYAISKDYTNMLLRTMSRTLDIDFIWCRLSNIYSSDLSIGNIISYEIRELINGRIPQFSKGEQPYNFIYIKDCMNALLCIGSGICKHEEYFIGGIEQYQLKDYLMMVNEYIDPKIKIGIGERGEDGLQYSRKWFDITSLKEDFSFVPKYSFEEGMKECAKIIKIGRDDIK